MANTIRILRSASTNTPASLLQGELANSELGSPNAINELFIGTAGPTVFKLLQNTNGAPAQPTAGLATTTMTGSDWIVFDDAGTPSRALISGINLSLFNDDVVSGNYVTGVSASTGITIGGTGTAPTVALDYLGTDNFIDSATNLEGTGIAIGDTIIYHDATDDNVKKGFISDIPVFTSSTVGFATASGGGSTNYLRADGTWAAPPGGAASNSFATMTVTDTDSGFTWAETGSAVAENSADTLTWVSGTDIDIDVDATNDAIRIAFTNASGYTTNTGTVTAVTGGTGVSSTGGTTPEIALTVDELAEKTGALVGTDRLVGTTSTTNWAETISGIPLSIFNNDSNWTSNTGTLTGITAGTLIDVSGTTNITVDVDLSEAAEAVYAPATDYLLFLDGGATGTAAKESGADFATALAGTGLAATSGVLALDFSELADLAGSSVVGTDELILQDGGTAESRVAINEIEVGLFANATTEYVSENDTIVVADWNWVLDEDTMSSDSAVHVPTQQSVKAYVDTAVSSGVTYKGAFDPTAGAGAGSPDLDSITSVTGDMYTVTVAGTYNWTTGSAILEIGDVLIAESDGVLNDAADWTIVQQNLSAATITTPGYVSVGAQTFGGTKTFEDISGNDSGATLDSFIIDGGTF